MSLPWFTIGMSGIVGQFWLGFYFLVSEEPQPLLQQSNTYTGSPTDFD